LPTIEEYNNMSTAYLVDILAQQTEKFTQLMADKEFTGEYETLKDVIHQLQAVIESRKVSSISEPNLSFTAPDSTA
jgi:hypothetical protein